MSKLAIFAPWGLLLLPSLAYSQTERVVNLFAVKSLLTLGSMDKRYGAGIGYQHIQPNRRWSFKGNPAKLNIEGYASWTKSDWFWAPPGNRYQVGILFSARYQHRMNASTDWFWEAGWGAQLANRKTHDLDSILNSTPTIGIGAVFHQSFYVTFRLMHISNAGLSGRNKGQNQLMLMLGSKL
ncbi:MAG: acyloxyacyl hydrolase [Armatimonadetes bacterium]|nr:acyloxyacyl hydrolase [Armatimonadota bacterium]